MSLNKKKLSPIEEWGWFFILIAMPLVIAKLLLMIPMGFLVGAALVGVIFILISYLSLMAK